MELACTGFLKPSTSIRLSNFHGKAVAMIPRKVRCISKCFNDRSNSSNICSFPRIPPPRKTIPSLKVIPDQTGRDTSNLSLEKILKFCSALLQFARPEILIGKTIAFTAIMSRTWMDNTHLVKLSKSILLLRVMVVLVAVYCMAINVNGINQIFDIEIDKINKPYYPLASKKLSLQSAWMTVISSITIGITVSVILKSGSFLSFFLCNTLLGLLYSVPPFSTKRSTIGAPLTGASMLITSTLGLSAAATTILGVPFKLSTPILALAIFGSLFVVVSAALKDFEDVEGDKKFNVPTLVSIYGPRKVAFFAFGSIVLTYIGAIGIAVLLPQIFKQNIMIPTHAILALFVIFQAWKLEKENYNKEASRSMYQSITKLLVIEFVLFPFI